MCCSAASYGCNRCVMAAACNAAEQAKLTSVMGANHLVWPPIASQSWLEPLKGGNVGCWNRTLLGSDWFLYEWSLVGIWEPGSHVACFCVVWLPRDLDWLSVRDRPTSFCVTRHASSCTRRAWLWRNTRFSFIQPARLNDAFCIRLAAQQHKQATNHLTLASGEPGQALCDQPIAPLWLLPTAGPTPTLIYVHTLLTRRHPYGVW